jgi:acetyltransferase-like isoleucine patch superfamily enzyme
MTLLSDPKPPRTIEGDWHPGTIPNNVEMADSCLIETSYSFVPYRSEVPCGLRMARGAGIYTGTTLDVGPRGRVSLGECAIVTAVQIVCDTEIEIGAYALISWNVILMDSYRVPLDPQERRRILEAIPHSAERCMRGAEGTARPIRIGKNVWIGFDSVVLPGVTIGEGSIVGARSVLDSDVPAYTIAAGNPARVVRELSEKELAHHAA